MDKEKIRNAAQLVIKHGALDVSAKLNYRDVHYWCKKAGMTESLDYDHLEAAAHNVMEEREADGRMIWEIDIDKFADEYIRLAGLAE